MIFLDVWILKEDNQLDVRMSRGFSELDGHKVLRKGVEFLSE